MRFEAKVAFVNGSKILPAVVIVASVVAVVLNIDCVTSVVAGGLVDVVVAVVVVVAFGSLDVVVAAIVVVAVLVVDSKDAAKNKFISRDEKL